MIFAFLIGMLSGLRSATPTACIAWAAYLERLELPRPLSFLATTLGLGLTAAVAVLELIGDKLPGAPNRTGLVGMLARLTFGGLAGACVGAAVASPLLACAALGSLGAVLGAYVGFYARTGTVNALGMADLKVALLEDFLCLAGTLFLLSRL